MSSLERDAGAARPRLLFVSPRFLFPADSGGRIRTTEILRGLRGGRFEIVLACPVSGDQAHAHRLDLQAISDRQAFWKAGATGMRSTLRRLICGFSGLPVSVATDRSRRARRVIEQQLAHRPGVVVFDFVHAAVLAPATVNPPSVLFTHNVEAEIFERHAATARNVLARLVWRDQSRKMRHFERHALHRFGRIIAVSERDKQTFRERYQVDAVEVIPTGVNLEYFRPVPCARRRRVVFTGSMDWLANQDGIQFFLEEVWPGIAAAVPDASMTVIGRTPPAGLVDRARVYRAHWRFTGSVVDVRPHVQGADVFVIPLRVGGGTRIKAFEAMAMGVPVVSTSVGVEGLMVEPDAHYLRADSAAELASAVITLLREPELGAALAARARAHVAAHFSSAQVSRRFEEICLGVISTHALAGVACAPSGGSARFAASAHTVSD